MKVKSIQREEEKEQPRATVAPDGAQHVTQARGGCGPLGIGRRHSVAPLEAGNGEEGLFVLQDEWVDLLLLDIKMPRPYTGVHEMRIPLLAAAIFAAAPSFAQDTAWVDDARKVAGSVPPKLLTVLKTEIDKGGPEGAIEVCRDKAPAMAKAASEETGWAIRRVSLKNRNPKAVPDAWERAALEDFDRRAAAGETAMTLEKAEVVSENGKQVRRYMRALPTQELCMNCA